MCPRGNPRRRPAWRARSWKARFIGGGAMAARVSVLLMSLLLLGCANDAGAGGGVTTGGGPVIALTPAGSVDGTFEVRGLEDAAVAELRAFDENDERWPAVFAVRVGGFLLVEPLQAAVVALVQAPRSAYRQPQPVEILEHELRGEDRALEQRRVNDVEVVAFLREQLRGAVRLGLSLRGEADVVPAGESILQIPGTLAVAQ